MKKLREKLMVLLKHFNHKESRKLQITQFIRVLTTLENLKIDDEKLIDEIKKLILGLESIKNGDLTTKKSYKKSYYLLKQNLQNNYSLIEKGTYTNRYLGMGMTIGLTVGIVVGIVYLPSRSTAITFGMMIGMSMGAVLGTIREKKMTEMGKSY